MILLFSVLFTVYVTFYGSVYSTTYILLTTGLFYCISHLNGSYDSLILSLQLHANITYGSHGHLFLLHWMHFLFQTYTCSDLGQKVNFFCAKTINKIAEMLDFMHFNDSK